MAISKCMSDVSRLHFYTLATLVDITATGQTRYSPDKEKERNQQRNWETVLQVCGIRAQPISIYGPRCIEYDLDKLQFGDMYKGLHKVWVACIGVEHEGIYEKDGNKVGHLETDFEQVPIINGLDETAKFMLPIFYPHGAIKNIYFIDEFINVNNI